MAGINFEDLATLEASSESIPFLAPGEVFPPGAEVRPFGLGSILPPSAQVSPRPGQLSPSDMQRIAQQPRMQRELGDDLIRQLFQPDAEAQLRRRLAVLRSRALEGGLELELGNDFQFNPRTIPGLMPAPGSLNLLEQLGETRL